MAKREKRYHLYLDPDVVEWYMATFGGDLGLSRAIREVMKSYKSMVESKLAAQHISKRTLSDDEQQRLFESVSGKGPGSNPGD